eukprot:13104816-Alexandrium_andersonii.AAC.1
MSASLVGSEMCIRDRPIPGITEEGAAHVGHGLLTAAGSPAAHLHGVAPVSYTHLTLPTICSV